MKRDDSNERYKVMIERKAIIPVVELT